MCFKIEINDARDANDAGQAWSCKLYQQATSAIWMSHAALVARF